MARIPQKAMHWKQETDLQEKSSILTFILVVNNGLLRSSTLAAHSHQDRISCGDSHKVK